MKSKIKSLYSCFFDSMEIHSESGQFKYSELKIRFATLPYIGDEYETAKQRIVFIGLDMGKDETTDTTNNGHIQSLEERRDNIATDCSYNPHIAGTYISALYLLKDIYGWNDVWGKVNSYPTCFRATEKQHHEKSQNPLYYIALTNYFKFVGIDRRNRSGGEDRRYINKKAEIKLLIDEIRILNPDIVIFQGNAPINDILPELKKMNLKILKALHPSNRIKAGRQPQRYVNSIAEI